MLEDPPGAAPIKHSQVDVAVHVYELLDVPKDASRGAPVVARTEVATIEATGNSDRGKRSTLFAISIMLRSRGSGSGD